jgi:alkanesulfonate monooxygenase SsuD/methylene tetrahydromethanopterin reductase-like flavin-dependent oxidoreductase (luciferase family)
LYQAGASDRGRIFAARHAECVFVNGTNMGHAGRVVADLRARAGSRPIQVFAGATIVTAPTEAEARDRLEEYRRHASVEGALAHAAASLGIDFARFEMDEPIDASASQAIQSNIESIAASLGVGWTKRMLIDRFILGSRQTPIVGSPSQVADALQRWVAEADVDGFNLSRTVIPECLEDFIRLIIPLLQDRGAFKTAYPLGTYRRKLFGGGDRLPDDHSAARERWVEAIATP